MHGPPRLKGDLSTLKGDLSTLKGDLSTLKAPTKPSGRSIAMARLGGTGYELRLIPLSFYGFA
jgi:hypothetical protein